MKNPPAIPGDQKWSILHVTQDVKSCPLLNFFSGKNLGTRCLPFSRQNFHIKPRLGQGEGKVGKKGSRCCEKIIMIAHSNGLKLTSLI